MQLWPWANVKTGCNGFGLVGNEGLEGETCDATWEEGNTHIVVMKPDILHDSAASSIRAVLTVHCSTFQQLAKYPGQRGMHSRSRIAPHSIYRGEKEKGKEYSSVIAGVDECLAAPR